jgi:glycosyltransferase involved in cell wall biosynthesis
MWGSTAEAFAVIVPARDATPFLRASLPPLLAAAAGHEVLVIDDASRDETAAVAAALGARVVTLSEGSGPAAARNAGARAASGAPEILVFLDADVRVHADTLVRLLAPFSDPTVTATFGSYDDAPPVRSTISLYKNLAHHFVHQRSGTEASTFWAGCGAIRRDVFGVLGGFDERYLRPSIEDVELGYRLTAAGHRIRLVHAAQVKHLKRWMLLSWLQADLRDRAIPWARLVRAGRGLPRDLNFTWRDRAATALVALALLLVALAVLRPGSAVLAALALAAAAVIDVPFARFCARRVSLRFALAATGLHLLHRAVALAGLLLGLLLPRQAASLPARQ